MSSCSPAPREREVTLMRADAGVARQKPSVRGKRQDLVHPCHRAMPASRVTGAPVLLGHGGDFLPQRLLGSEPPVPGRHWRGASKLSLSPDSPSLHKNRVSRRRGPRGRRAQTCPRGWKGRATLSVASAHLHARSVRAPQVPPATARVRLSTRLCWAASRGRGRPRLAGLLWLTCSALIIVFIFHWMYWGDSGA